MSKYIYTRAEWDIVLACQSLELRRDSLKKEISARRRKLKETEDLLLQYSKGDKKK